MFKKTTGYLNTFAGINSRRTTTNNATKDKPVTGLQTLRGKRLKPLKLQRTFSIAERACQEDRT